MNKVILIASLLFPLILKLGNAQETEELKGILKFHNKVRLDVFKGIIPNQPQAKKMPKLKWSQVLAEKAQEHVDKCILESGNLTELYVGKYDSVGQSVAEHVSIQSVLDTWFEESKDYNFDKNDCAKECGNYKQMVFSETKIIGCGTMKCGEKHMVVCNYAPGADGGRPYKKASGGDQGEEEAKEEK